MLRLIKLLINKQADLIYIILLCFSFILHIQFDYNKRILVSKNIKEIIYKIHIIKTDVKNYFYLKEINEILIQENAKIRSINR